MSSDKMASLNIEVVKKQKKIGSMAKSDADAPKTIQIGDDRVAPERHKIDTQTQKVRERERELKTEEGHTRSSRHQYLSAAPGPVWNSLEIGQWLRNGRHFLPVINNTRSTPRQTNMAGPHFEEAPIGPGRAATTLIGRPPRSHQRYLDGTAPFPPIGRQSDTPKERPCRKTRSDNDHWSAVAGSLLLVLLFHGPMLRFSNEIMEQKKQK